jgi:undecaprenyl-diphosphatase
MTYLHAIILGIVEGITEFLPISSTGHLIVTGHLLGIPVSEFTKSFDIFIQLGAILAVVYFYRHTIFKTTETWKKVLAAFIPTAVVGLILYPFVKGFLLGNIEITIISFIVGGIILVAFELWQEPRRKDESKMYKTVAEVPYKSAIIIGLSQVIAMIPGVSRSATTVVSGELLSLSRKAVVEFSFLLAIPTMLAATSLDMLSMGFVFSTQEYLLLATGFTVSFFVALLVIKWLLSYVEKHSFIAFGMYRILAGLVFFYIFF